MMTTLNAIDTRHIWHPFTQHATARPNIPIIRGEGEWLFDAEGKRLLDLISSWWVTIHGHAHPAIAEAIYTQARQLEQVIFAGFTHEPALRLAEKLASLLPAPLQRVFFTDNGSTAVEVALKMAYQYWYNRGEHTRTRFIAFEGAYHGDTFGAMAVGRSSGFYGPFEPLLFDVLTLPYPATWEGDPDVAQKEADALEALRMLLEQYPEGIAGLICEPLLQGSSGMRICRPEFLKLVVDTVRDHQVLVIFDEVMTGFGRTGSLFAMEQVGRTPDVVCLAKGLTGGFLPLAVTVCQDEIYEAFLSQSFDKALVHGHSYTANPLGCAAACASLALFESGQPMESVHRIASLHRQQMPQLKESVEGLVAPRIQGTVAAFNLFSPKTTYTDNLGKKIERAALAEGLLLRPLGNCIYMLPPYCTASDALTEAYATLPGIIRNALSS